MRELAVYHGETRVGTLLGTESTVGFRYDENWTSFPLSFDLPIREGIFSDDRTRAYFANLMPEDRIRALARDMALACRKTAPKLARIHDPSGKYDDFFKAVLRKILASCTKMLALTEKPKPRILP